MSGLIVFLSVKIINKDLHKFLSLLFLVLGSPIIKMVRVRVRDNQDGVLGLCASVTQ